MLENPDVLDSLNKLNESAVWMIWFFLFGLAGSGALLVHRVMERRGLCRGALCAKSAQPFRGHQTNYVDDCSPSALGRPQPAPAFKRSGSKRKPEPAHAGR